MVKDGVEFGIVEKWNIVFFGFSILVAVDRMFCFFILVIVCRILFG